MLKPLITLALIAACVGQIAAAEKKPGLRTIAELQAEIEKHLRETGVPGVAVAIVSRDKIEWIGGVGLADVATNRPVTSKTLFQIGSITKGFTALAALKLQEEGKLKLTDTLRHWLPECPIDNPWESTDPIRLVHLMEHTAGVPDCRGSAYAHNDPKPATMADALALEPGIRFTRWRPGNYCAYTNYGSLLAAAMVEKASGQRFEDYVREKIFLPLGMNSASYFLTPEVAQTITTGYERDGRTVVPCQHLIYRPAGAIKASAEDMANYLRFHLQRGSFNGRQIISTESFDRMEVPGTLPSVQVGVTSGYGLFNVATNKYGYEGHGHDGWIWGGRASMLYFPELGVGRIIMMNSTHSTAFMRIIGAVDKYLLRDVEEPAKAVGATLPEELQQSLPGYYMNISPRDSDHHGLMDHYVDLRRVDADAQGLTFRPPVGRLMIRWVPVSEKLFRLETAAKPSMALIRDEDGEPLLQYDWITYRRISPLRVWLPLVGFPVSYLLALSSLLFAVIWGLRKALGRLPNPGPWSVRLWPLLGAAAPVGYFWIFFAAESRGFALLGRPNLWTIGLMLITLLIPLSAIFSAVSLWRHRRAPMNRFTYWHAVLVTLGLVFITGFFFSWGLIGVRMWV